MQIRNLDFWGALALMITGFIIVGTGGMHWYHLSIPLFGKLVIDPILEGIAQGMEVQRRVDQLKKIADAKHKENLDKVLR